jgi:hypothetical protein
MTASNNESNITNTDIRQDLYQLAGLKPSVFITAPQTDYYRGVMQMSYYAISPNEYPITNYSISFLDYNSTFNMSITNDTKNITYNYNTINSPDGVYYVIVNATDNMTQNGYDVSDLIIIDNTKPSVSINNNGSTENYIVLNVSDAYMNVSVYDTNLNNFTIYLYNSTGSIMQSIVRYANENNIETFGGLITGLYIINITAYDKADNINYSDNRYFNVTVTTPIIPEAVESEISGAAFAGIIIMILLLCLAAAIPALTYYVIIAEIIVAVFTILAVLL